jgi:hypothetical protein
MNSITEMLGWVGSVFTLVGVYSTSRKLRSAFLLYLAGNALWLVKSACGSAWDVFATNAALAVLSAYGYYAWGAADRNEARQRADRVKQAEAAQHARDMKDYINVERAAMGQKPVDDVLDDVKENPEKYRVAWLNEQGEEVRLNVNQTRCVKEHLAMLAAMGEEEKITIDHIADMRKGATY